MRIIKVSVAKLFEMHDHEIQLMLESRITIIYGPNGIGKTILLKMIHGIFNSRYEVFYEIPFERFTVSFDSGDSMFVSKTEQTREFDEHGAVSPNQGENSASRQVITVNLVGSNGEKREQYVLRTLQEVESQFYEEVESIPDLRQVESRLWLNRKTGSVLNMDEVINEYKLQSKVYGSEMPWFSQICKEIDTGFVQAQRLQVQTAAEPFVPYYLRREIPSIPGSAVEMYSNEIVEKIQDTLTEYGELSQLKDRSFPMRLIETGDSQTFSRDELLAKLEQLELDRSKLMKLGLLDTGGDAPDIPKLGSGQEDLNEVLSIYVQDIEEKFRVFDELSAQLTILTRILNDRFENKTLEIHKRDGFVFVPPEQDRPPIPILNLSSGEQQELVLLYELLFRVEPNSLILIDEPELSLHVMWQRRFLEDIGEIIAEREFDVLIATHSPQIIHDKWDWTVPLVDSESD